MSLSEELERIAVAARGFAAKGEELAAVIPAEPAAGIRVYLCAFLAGGERSWLALCADGRPLADRSLLRDAVSIAALCELADELAGSPDEVELRIATPSYLDAVGASGNPDFASALKESTLAVEGLSAEVEGAYKVELR